MITMSKISNRNYLLAYLEGDKKEQVEERGTWLGRGAAMMKIKDQAVDEKRFLKIFDEGKTKAGTEKSYGVDITFSAPKCFTLLYHRSDEATREEMREVFQKAILSGTQAIEENTYYRKSENGKEEYLLAKSLTLAAFVHHTSRPVNGISDPNLHAHVAIPKQCLGRDGSFYSHTLFDMIHEKDGNGNNQQTKRYIDEKFQAPLVEWLKGKGYELERGKEGTFEIKGIDREVVDAFSKRTVNIEERAKELGTDDYNLKKTISLHQRETKNEGQGMTELREGWQRKMDGLGFTEEKAESLKGKKIADRSKPLNELLGKDEKTITEKRLKTLSLQEAKFSDRQADDILKQWKENDLKKIGGRQYLVKDSTTKSLAERIDKERLPFERNRFEQREGGKGKGGSKGGGSMSLAQAQSKASQMMKTSKSDGSMKASERIASRLDELERGYAVKMLELSKADGKGDGAAVAQAMSDYQKERTALVSQLNQAVQREQDEFVR